jgi:hypothetical protein
MVRRKDPRALLWCTRDLVQGNVSTQMFAHPNIPATFGRWTYRNVGDYDFIRATTEKCGAGNLTWCEDIVCIKDYSVDRCTIEPFLRYYQYPCTRPLPETPHVNVCHPDPDGRVMELSLLVHRQPDGSIVIDKAAFRYEASNAALVLSGLFVELIEGSTADDAMLIRPQDLVTEFHARASVSPAVAGVHLDDAGIRCYDVTLSMASLPIEVFRRAVSRV